jgi:hypothetical protein
MPFESSQKDRVSTTSTRLPKLEKFCWNTWVSRCVPLNFGFVPSLGELDLSSCAICDQPPFKLSEILHGTICIHTLTLDFQGENVSYFREVIMFCFVFVLLSQLSESHHSCKFVDNLISVLVYSCLFIF